METFIEIVKEMRSLQKEYFKNRDRTTLQKCKDLERRVDKFIQDQDQEPVVSSNQLSFLS